MTRHLRRVPAGVGRTLAVATIAVLLASCGGPFPQSALEPASDFAVLLDDLFRGIFFWAVIVFVLVEGALLVAIFRFRDREGRRRPRAVHGNTLLEISWTLAPALVLVLIAVPTFRAIWSVDRPTTDPDALVVEAIGHQWWWEFRYPELGVVTANEMHVPVGRTIDVRLTSADVIHSFWFPRAGGKRDVIPGRENHLWFRMDSTGVFYGQCAEFCGLSHALMKMEMVSETPEEFAAWVEAQRRPAFGTEPPAPPATSAEATDDADGDAAPGGGQESPPPAGAEADTGGVWLTPEQRRIVEAGQQAFLSSGCIACHRVAGTPAAAGVLGPDLTHVGSRRTIAAGILENTPENMAAWLRDPAAVKPGVLMPALDLDEETIRALTAWLDILE
ncbi:MAG: cytochrome c oxidase subunit II [Gemmatimonadota bacterium]|nr:cytochrome c oxidase subunit II [Gemmatimonadota bacterium]